MSTTHLTTVESLLRLGGDARYELILGELREVSPSGFKSNRVLGRVFTAINAFAEAHALGYVTVAKAGYILGRNPDTVVAPDVGFVRRDRVQGMLPDRGYFPGPPDLAVEIISPTDEPADLLARQQVYDRFGVTLVWWIDPERHLASVHAVGWPIQEIDRTGSLDGEAILLGFSLALASIFKD